MWPSFFFCPSCFSLQNPPDPSFYRLFRCPPLEATSLVYDFRSILASTFFSFSKLLFGHVTIPWWSSSERKDPARNGVLKEATFEPFWQKVTDPSGKCITRPHNFHGMSKSRENNEARSEQKIRGFSVSLRNDLRSPAMWSDDLSKWWEERRRTPFRAGYSFSWPIVEL